MKERNAKKGTSQMLYSVFPLFLVATIIWSRKVLSLNTFVAEIQCSPNSRCPPELPCCSQYGQCGTGAVCVNGCNPKGSFDFDSCLPIPALIPPMQISFDCTSGPKPKDDDYEDFEEDDDDYENEVEVEVANNRDMYNYNYSREKMKRDTKITEPNTLSDSTFRDDEEYLKDWGLINHVDYLLVNDEDQAEQMLRDYSFTHSGFTSIDEETGEIILGMPKRTSGSVLSTSKSFLYGKAGVTIKTARGQGVVTAIVLMSSVGDEIDFEFLGGNLNELQTNYYYERELIYSRMQKTPAVNTWEGYHRYEIDWNEERIIWYVDGQPIRQLNKFDTWEPGLQIYKYPQTPMRLEVAIWPGGNEGNNPGTIGWAGGMIDWENSEDIIQHGQFITKIHDIQVFPYSNAFVPQMTECLSKLPVEGSETLEDDDYLKLTYLYDTYSNSNDNGHYEITFACDFIPYIFDPATIVENHEVESSNNTKDNVLTEDLEDISYNTEAEDIEEYDENDENENFDLQSKKKVKGKNKKGYNSEFIEVDPRVDFIPDVRRLTRLDNGLILMNSTVERSEYFRTEEASSNGVSNIKNRNPIKNIVNFLVNLIGINQ